MTGCCTVTPRVLREPLDNGYLVHWTSSGLLLKPRQACTYLSFFSHRLM
jgi:hypothetical protein